MADHTLFPSILPEDAEAEAKTATDPDDGCPWCDEYRGDYLAQHAASAHPDEWEEGEI